MRSRIIYAFRQLAPNRRGACQASRERFLTSGVPGSDPRRFGFGDRAFGPLRRRPAARGYLSLGSQSEVTLRQLKILVSF